MARFAELAWSAFAGGAVVVSAVMAASRTPLDSASALFAPDAPGLAGSSSFVNFETPPVHPIEITPDGTQLLVTNTADARIEIFSLTSGTPVSTGSVPVGIDPVSVRARTATEAWVVNTISDSISIVDLTTRNVIATLKTADEPRDVVFAGSPQRAFVSCSKAGVVQVFNPASLSTAPTSITIDALDPRAMAVSPDGSKIYAAMFLSGNASTILGGGSTMSGGFPPNVVSDVTGPYGGTNPPPNSGAAFVPAIAPANQPALAVGLIVQKNAASQWMDDNAHDWSGVVSGANAAKSGRPVGWDMPDRDVAIIDAASLSVTGYATGLMNACMAIGVNPVTGRVTVVGTDATNVVRFEPVLKGKFIRVEMASFLPATPGTKSIVDLNPHLTYATSTVPQTERDKSIGDPRAIVWNPAGTRGYVAGMGSDNVIVIDTAGARAGLAQTIPVGAGAAGLALDGVRNKLYVLNRYDASVSVINLATETEAARVAFFDPTPAAIKIGRKHFYDTHKNSGLGQLACASCHIDGKIDHLAWDLGDPSGAIAPVTGNNLGAGIPGITANFQPFHPMKGPMTTQTFQDIVGKEPFHWRGDRTGLEAFSGAFIGLQGDDVTLTATEMQQFEDFVASITYPPNPYRNFDNTLPTNLPLPGHFKTGRFGSAGQPLANGNAVTGLSLYRSNVRRIDRNVLSCVACHTLPTGAGTDSTLSGNTFVPIPAGPQGEHHLMLVPIDGSTNISVKVPQLRNMQDKFGFTMQGASSLAGFGYLHDGSIDTLERFVTEPAFNPANDQEVSNLVALMLAFSGSDLPAGSTSLAALEPPGPPSNDVPASVGTQTTFTISPVPPAQTTLLSSMIAQANAGKVGLIAKGRLIAQLRGWRYDGAGNWQSDRSGQTTTTAALTAAAAAGSEITFTVVPLGTQTRAGIDRNLDGCLDGDEGLTCNVVMHACNPADICGVGATYSGGTVDVPPDGQLTIEDFLNFLSAFGDATGCPGTAPCNPADICGVGATYNAGVVDIGPDGDLTIEDFLNFLSAFGDATGCP